MCNTPQMVRHLTPRISELTTFHLEDQVGLPSACPYIYPVPTYPRVNLCTGLGMWRIFPWKVQSSAVKNDHAAHISKMSGFITSVPVLVSLAPGIDRDLHSTHVNSFFSLLDTRSCHNAAYFWLGGTGESMLCHFCSIHNQLMVSLGVTLSLQVSFAALRALTLNGCSPNSP